MDINHLKGLLQYETLLNDPISIDSSSFPSALIAAPDGYTSRSHYHNVLLSHGEHEHFHKSMELSSNIHHYQDSTLMNAHNSSEEKADISFLNDNTDFVVYHKDNMSEEGSVSDSIIVEESNAPNKKTTDYSERLLEMQAAINSASWSSCFSREDKACIFLEDIISQAGGPLYLYDSIMAWACQYKEVLPSRVPFINRTALYKSLAIKIHGDLAESMKPKQVKTTLPSGRHCSVTIFNLYSQIITLLSNEAINQWDNYFFSPTKDDPFHLNTFSDWDNGVFDDIETSIWYKRTQTSIVTDADTEILVPICLFIDSTILSLSGTLSLEPVMFSLMIHNRETRKNPEAWLPLGYIHDPTSLAGKKYCDTVEKYTDYHAMLSIVFMDLIELVNQHNGLTWDFCNVPGKNEMIRKKLLFRVAFIIGDTKGHDILCCRMGSHNHTPGLCRDCDMTTENADNPFVPCNFLKQNDLQQMTEEQLRAKSFLRVMTNPFNRFSFGASPYGINCATAIDIIHGILLGLMEYLYNTFTDQLTGKQWDKLSETVSFLATFCSRAIPGFPKIHHFKKGLNAKGIMTATKKLARCFLVLLSLKTNSFCNYLTDCAGKLPSVVQK
jgi:hypothetical protein